MPKKSLGQYFLRCRWVANTLIRASGITAKDTVLEIGPGKGALTFALARAARRVIAIEKDEALAHMLREALRGRGVQNVVVQTGDILAVSKRNIPGLSEMKVVANIPYYLTSRLLRYFLESEPRPRMIAITVQKEVAERLTALPPAMNLLALSVQTFGRAEIIDTVPRACFSPKPNVTSAIVRISGVSDEFFKEIGIRQADFFSLARAAFSKKRKTLASSLKGLVEPETFARAGIKQTARPQELTRTDWARLVRAKIAHKKN